MFLAKYSIIKIMADHSKETTKKHKAELAINSFYAIIIVVLSLAILLGLYINIIAYNQENVNVESLPANPPLFFALVIYNNNSII